MKKHYYLKDLTKKDMEELIAQTKLPIYKEDIEELESELKGYEKTFGYKSSEIHEKIDSGELKETHEICVWIGKFEVYQEMKEKFEKY